MKDLEELITEIFDHKRYGIRLGLERIRYLVRRLNNPQKKFKVVHVGGTNGKGSVCRFIESVLREAGYKVGLYTSPHLIDFKERFVVNGNKIKDEELHEVLRKVLSIAEKMNDKPTFFEISTACAFEYFKESDVDFGIIEVGLGGRYDATNVVEPYITVITNVERDHIDILGKDIDRIAVEKAGIIKKGVPVITGCSGRTLDIIAEEARHRGAEVIRTREWERISNNLRGQVFKVKGLLDDDYILRTKMLGKFQGFNLSLSVITLDKLRTMGVSISDENLRRGIEKAFHPGRMHVLSEKPILLLDGAHNLNAIRSLKESITEDFAFQRLITVIGILKDKEFEKMVREMDEVSDLMIITKPDNERACDPEKLSSYANKTEKIITENVPAAIRIARDLAERKDMICITGSLYTVGEAIKQLLD